VVRKTNERRDSSVEFGKIVQAVDTLTEESLLTRQKTDKLVTCVAEMKITLESFKQQENSAHVRMSKIEEAIDGEDGIKASLNRGKGMFAGVTLAAGAVGGFVSWGWHKIFP
jgi:hypothetical protein